MSRILSSNKINDSCSDIVGSSSSSISLVSEVPLQSLDEGEARRRVPFLTDGVYDGEVKCVCVCVFLCASTILFLHGIKSKKIVVVLLKNGSVVAKQLRPHVILI